MLLCSFSAGDALIATRELPNSIWFGFR